MTEIRSLSSPSLDGIQNAEGYSERLRENFVRIGRLASENRDFLENALFPLINSDKKLSESDAHEMDRFCEELLNVAELENIDPAIISMITDRLLKDAENKGELLFRY